MSFTLVVPNSKQVRIGKWSLLEVLGTGATSTVYLGYDPETRKYAAIKLFKKIEPRNISAVKNEMQIQSSLKHEYILRLQEYYDDFSEQSKGMVTASFVVDYARGGDILWLIQTIKVFPERLARTYFHQLIDALEYMHKNSIAHRDIKPENIMLDDNYCIKLADFGCAAKFSPSRCFNTPIGTSKYFPPEEHLGIPYEGPAADLFATAIVLFAMVVGHMPFIKAVPDDNIYSLLFRGKIQAFWSKHEEIAKTKGMLKGLNKDFKNLLTKMLDPNPSKRPTLQEVKKSTWYNGPVLQRTEITRQVKELL